MRYSVKKFGVCEKNIPAVVETFLEQSKVKKKDMNKIKLFIIDFDGTALGGYEPYDRFPDILSDFLDELSSSGILWATCTTWHPFMQDKVFTKSKLRSRPVRLIGRTSMNIGFYINGKLCLDAEWDNYMISLKAEFMKNYVEEIREFLRKVENITFIEFFDYIFEVKFKDKKVIEKLKKNEIIKEKTYFQFTEENIIHIFPYYLSKDKGIKKIQEELQILNRETMVAGDWLIDIPFFSKEIAFYQIAPSNAHTEIKKIVEENEGVVSYLPYADGVVDAARKILFGR